MENPVRFTGSLTTLPAEYWETEGSIHGALCDRGSADGILLRSIRGIPVGTQLNIRIFYANKYELEAIKVVGTIVWRDLYIAEDWQGYKYGLEFVHAWEEDRRRLKDLFNSHLESGEFSGGEDLSPQAPACCGEFDTCRNDYRVDADGWVL